MKKFPFGSKIVVITAHPDDESFTAAGTIYQNYQSGGETFLICASAGEKGTSHLKEPLPEDEFKSIRQQELKNAGKILGINKIEILNYPDSALDEHEESIYSEVLGAVQKHRPDYIVSFDGNGLNGHSDHATVGRVSTKIHTELSIPYIKFTFPTNVRIKIEELRKSRQAHGKYIDSITTLEPDIKVDINPEIKLKALRAHTSQHDQTDPFAGFPKAVADSIRQYEYLKLTT